MGIYFGGLLKIDGKSILADFILVVGHHCWIIDICDIPHPLRSYNISGCFMEEFAITEFNPHDFTYASLIAAWPHSHV